MTQTRLIAANCGIIAAIVKGRILLFRDSKKSSRLFCGNEMILLEKGRLLFFPEQFF